LHFTGGLPHNSLGQWEIIESHAGDSYWINLVQNVENTEFSVTRSNALFTFDNISLSSYHCYCQSPGDADGNGALDIDDAVYIIGYIFSGGPDPTPYAVVSGDATCDCVVDIDDIVYLISYIFSAGPAPCSWSDSTYTTSSDKKSRHWPMNTWRQAPTPFHGTAEHQVVSRQRQVCISTGLRQEISRRVVKCY
jgi:hypothetical protein